MTGNKHYRIASIPGDGIGMEVVPAAIEVVKKLAEVMKTFRIESTHVPWGTAYYKQNGKYVDNDVLNVLRGYNATLFGAIGAPGNWQSVLPSVRQEPLPTQTLLTTSHRGTFDANDHHALKKYT
jgi:isocitrate/isopropylmalate dehydrogenase